MTDPADDAGTGTPELEAVGEEIRKAGRILVTSHVNADGDAVGSSLALARGVAVLGKAAGVVLSDFPERYRFLDGEGLVQVVSEPPPPGFFERYDLGIVLDASEPSRIGHLEKGFFAAPFARACIDHHLEGRRDGYRCVYVRTDAAAAGVLVLEVLDLLGVRLEPSIAEALFVAVATDTGWFRYSNASPRVFRDVARLVEAGARPERLHTSVYEELSVGRQRLQGIVLEGLKLELDGALVWSALDRETISSAGLPRTQFEGLIDPLRAISGVEVAALLTESDPGTWKLSLRSRGDASVQRIAARLGGGGHARAAGCTAEGGLDSVLDRLRRAVRDELDRSSRRAGK